VQYISTLYNYTRSQYEQLLQPSGEIMKVLRSLYRGEVASSPFSHNYQPSTETNTAASSVFRSAVQSNSVFSQNTNTNHSVFGQAPVNTNASVFGQPSVFAQTPQNQSIFDQKPNVNANTDITAKSIFAQASHVFGQAQVNQSNSIFANNQPAALETANAGTTAKSIFAQASQNIFNTNQSQNTSVFSQTPQSVFGGPFNPQPDIALPNQSHPFSSGVSNIFQITDKQNPDDCNIYSNITDVSNADMEAFSAADFKLGFIPEVPPPHSVC
jgi:hypothetical protein